MTHRFLSLAFLILGLALGTGCSSTEEYDTSTPEGAFNSALQYAEAKRYEEAISILQQVRSKFPYSAFAARSELKIADLHFERGSYIEAEANYQLFRELYPRNPQMDYVTYQIAMSFFNQLPPTIDRDLSSAYEALAFFENVITAYPNSKYVGPSRERRQEVVDKLAAKELYIADFYRQQKDHLSALGRYEGLISKYPEFQKMPEVYYGAARSAGVLNEPTKARSFAETLVRRHPESEQARKLRGEFNL